MVKQTIGALVGLSVLVSVIIGSTPAAAEPFPDIDEVQAVEGGVSHTCILTVKGQVSCWGRDGTAPRPGSTIQFPHPATTVPGIDGNGALTDVRQISAGDLHTCALLSDRRVACWGDNSSGTLGDGSGSNSNTPVLVRGIGGDGQLGEVSQISSSGTHACAVLTDGRAACWGSNTSGQIGDGGAMDSDRTTPVLVMQADGGAPLQSVRQVATGKESTCAVLTDGRGLCWGSNLAGQLGSGTTVERSSLPQPVAGIDGAGQLTGMQQVAVGFSHVCATLTDKRAVCWGNNGGSLGDGTLERRLTPVLVNGVGANGQLTNVEAVSVGRSHSCAQLTGGGLVCWGSSSENQLGERGFPTRTSPILIRGLGARGQLSDVDQLSAGADHTCIISRGRLICWGLNNWQQLGTKTVDPRRSFFPLQIGNTVLVEVDAAPGGLQGVAVRPTSEDPAGQVKIDLFEAKSRHQRGQFLGSTRTDEDGRFGFQTGEGCYITVAIAPPGLFFDDGSRFSHTHNCVAAAEELILSVSHFATPGTISSTVVQTGNGFGVPAIKATLFEAETRWKRGGFLEATTSTGSGEFGFDELAADCYIVVVKAPPNARFRLGGVWDQQHVCVP